MLDDPSWRPGLSLRYRGGGLPMLAGLERADLHSLATDIEAESGIEAESDTRSVPGG